MRVRRYEGRYRDSFFDIELEGVLPRRKEGDRRPTRGWYSKLGLGAPADMEHSGGLGRISHVVILDENSEPKWDQPLFFEGVGAITIPVDHNDNIGLIQVERPLIRDMSEYKYHEVDFDSIGRLSWELPRGMPRKGENPEQTAQREAREELNTTSPFSQSVKVGECSPNSTYFAALQPTFVIRVDRSLLDAENPEPDLNEKIYKVKWFFWGEIEDMIMNGEIVCGMTLASLMMYQCSKGSVPGATVYNLGGF